MCPEDGTVGYMPMYYFHPIVSILTHSAMVHRVYSNSVVAPTVYTRVS